MINAQCLCYYDLTFLLSHLFSIKQNSTSTCSQVDEIHTVFNSDGTVRVIYLCAVMAIASCNFLSTWRLISMLHPTAKCFPGMFGEKNDYCLLSILNVWYVGRKNKQHRRRKLGSVIILSPMDNVSQLKTLSTQLQFFLIWVKKKFPHRWMLNLLNEVMCCFPKLCSWYNSLKTINNDKT